MYLLQQICGSVCLENYIPWDMILPEVLAFLYLNWFHHTAGNEELPGNLLVVIMMKILSSLFFFRLNVAFRLFLLKPCNVCYSLQTPTTSHQEACRFVMMDHMAQLCLRIVLWLEGLASESLDLAKKVCYFMCINVKV